MRISNLIMLVSVSVSVSACGAGLSQSDLAASSQIDRSVQAPPRPSENQCNLANQLSLLNPATLSQRDREFMQGMMQRCFGNTDSSAGQATNR